MSTAEQIREAKRGFCTDLHGEYQTAEAKLAPKPGAAMVSGSLGLYACNWAPAFYADLRGCTDAKRWMARHVEVCSACRCPTLMAAAVNIPRMPQFARWQVAVRNHRDVCQACREGQGIDVMSLPTLSMEAGSGQATPE